MSSIPTGRPTQCYCTHCGKQLEAGANFCTTCGAAVAKKSGVSGQEHLEKAMIAALDGSRNEDAIHEYRAAISAGLPPKDEVLVRAGLASLLVQEANHRCNGDAELLRSSLTRESIDNMEKALVLDRDHRTGHFAGLFRNELWNLDVLYHVFAMEKASRRGKAEAIDFLKAKITLCDYLLTCPLLNVLDDLAHLYRDTGDYGASETVLLQLVSSQPLHVYPGDQLNHEMNIRKQAAAEIQPTLMRRLRTTGTLQVPACASCGACIELSAKFCTKCGTAIVAKHSTPAQEHLANGRIASLDNRTEDAVREFREALAVDLPPKDEVDARAGLAEQLSILAKAGSTSSVELLQSPLTQESIEQMERALTLDREQQTGHFAGPNRCELWNLDIFYAMIAKDKSARNRTADAVDYLKAKISLYDYQLTCPLLLGLFELSCFYHESGNDKAAEATLLQLVYSQPVYVFGDTSEEALRKDAADNLEVVIKSQLRARMNAESGTHA